MKNSHLLRAIACMLFLAAGSANACSVDVESTGVEFAGKDMLLNFRIVPDTATASTVRFGITVRYMSHGEPKAQTFSYTRQTAGAMVETFPAQTEFDITEISAVRIDVVACSP